MRFAPSSAAFQRTFRTLHPTATLPTAGAGGWDRKARRSDWAGAAHEGLPANKKIDRRRSHALAQLASLANVPGARFVSLQKGPPSREAGEPPADMNLLDPTFELDDFADTAALVAALDLVLSVDTSVGHLAGAMGKPVWILSRFDAAGVGFSIATTVPGIRRRGCFAKRPSATGTA